MRYTFFAQLCRIILINYQSKHSFKLFSTNIWRLLKKPKFPQKYIALRSYGYECITHQSCWKCGQSIEPEMEQYFCVCGVVQPPITNRSYFQILGLPEHFDLDLKLLNEKFKKLQVILHPDKYTQKSEKEKEFSYNHSVVVNNAYETLKNPLKRGFYLLGLEKFSELTDKDLQFQDPTFLNDIFTINEQLIYAVNEKNKENFATIEIENNKAIDELISRISLAFKKNNDNLAKELLLMLKYRDNLNGKIKEFDS